MDCLQFSTGNIIIKSWYLDLDPKEQFILQFEEIENFYRRNASCIGYVHASADESRIQGLQFEPLEHFWANS